MLVPLVATPVTPAGTAAVQLNDVPGVALVRFTETLDVPEQIDWSGCENVTDGAGFTVIVKVFGCPLHPSNCGVTVMVAVTGVVPLLIAANAAMSPLPVAGSPIAGVLLLQL